MKFATWPVKEDAGHRAGWTGERHTRGMRTPWVTLMEQGVWTEGEQEGQAGSGKSRLHLLLWRYRRQARLLSPSHMPGVGHASLQPRQHCGKVTKRSGHSRGRTLVL